MSRDIFRELLQYEGKRIYQLNRRTDMIELLNKAAKDWTEIEIVIETIKLWSFLAENGDRTKEQYFGSEYVTIFCGCFLCAYYFSLAHRAKEKDNQLRGKKVCWFFNCCLKGNSVCGFNHNGSAFNMWIKSDDRYVREIAAKKIVWAAKRRYKELTGENYHE